MAKRVLDEQTRRVLLGYVPFSTEATIRYTPDEFINIADATLRPIFVVRSFTQAEALQLRTISMSYSKDNTNEQTLKLSQDILQVSRGCVLGWSNLFNAGTGEEIEFKGDTNGACVSELYAILPEWLKRSISEYIKKISGLNEPEILSLK